MFRKNIVILFFLFFVFVCSFQVKASFLRSRREGYQQIKEPKNGNEAFIETVESLVEEVSGHNVQSLEFWQNLGVQITEALNKSGYDYESCRGTLKKILNDDRNIGFRFHDGVISLYPYLAACIINKVDNQIKKMIKEIKKNGGYTDRELNLLGCNVLGKIIIDDRFSVFNYIRSRKFDGKLDMDLFLEIVNNFLVNEYGLCLCWDESGYMRFLNASNE